MTAHLDARLPFRPAPGPWADRGSCRTVDPALFYSAENGRSARQDTLDAKRICHGCPVKAECLEHALEVNELSGVWGGATPGERRQIRANRPRHCQVCDIQFTPVTTNQVRCGSDECYRRRPRHLAGVR